MKKLIVFIDALPYQKIKALTNLRELGHLYKVVPGVGYSVNLHYEIFEGKTPDQLKFLNYWITAKNLLRWPVIFKVFCDSHNRLFWGDKFIHKILRKIRLNKANIPFPYIGYFKRIHPEKDNLRAFFDEYHEVITSQNIKEKKGLRDLIALNLAHEKIKEKSKNCLVVGLFDLDYMGHEYGTNDERYIRFLRIIDNKVSTLVKEFKNYGGKDYYILSDHGMGDIKKEIQLVPEKTLGLTSKSSYIYFLDSTIARFWIFDTKLKNKIANFLNKLGEGIIINEKERKKFGISSKEFGDIIFILKDGFVFYPNFVSYAVQKASHGNLSSDDNQKGILISNQKACQDTEIKTIDLYNIIK